MKTIGMLGGMSWESTVTYYRTMNQEVNARLGGFHSAKALLYSVDFAELEGCLRAGDWDAVSRTLGDAAWRLEGAGADFLLICTNTMHEVFDNVADAVSIPVVHIADATADAIKARGLSRVGLLGTSFTMERTFFTDRLARHGIDTIVPESGARSMVHTVIFDELCQGVFTDESRNRYLDVIGELRGRGAQGIVLGCTEIGLLVRDRDTDLPLFDTAIIHAKMAVDMALEQESGRVTD
ncbi:MAG: aspartate/glutamate racemase family protein [Desulfatibacillaceae bacterium]